MHDGAAPSDPRRSSTRASRRAPSRVVSVGREPAGGSCRKRSAAAAGGGSVAAASAAAFDAVVLSFENGTYVDVCVVLHIGTLLVQSQK